MPVANVQLRVPRDWGRAQIKQALAGVDGVQCLKVRPPVKSKAAPAKGGAFEREFARKLSLWRTQGRDEYVYARRSGSGGSKRDRDGCSGSCGDIVCEKEIGRDVTDRWSFELKFVRDIATDVWSLLTGTVTARMRTILEQCDQARQPYERSMFIVLRQNHKDPIVITDDEQLAESMYSYALAGYEHDLWLFDLEQLWTLRPRALDAWDRELR